MGSIRSLSEEFYMKIINWNISYMKNTDNKISFLEILLRNEHDYIVILQEVTQTAYEQFFEAFHQFAHIEYSLHYRKPGPYDTRSRRLGIMILVSNSLNIKCASVLERALFPDRTLYLETEYHGKPLKVLGLHSITGCQHGKAKEIQYYSFAEAVDELKPDIIGIDANEPQIDHYDVSQMKFFDNYNKGNGCKTFFEKMKAHSLFDSYALHYNPVHYEEGKPLITSHVLKRGSKEVRYDFLFVNTSKLNVLSSHYYLNPSWKAGSDHALVECLVK